MEMSSPLIQLALLESLKTDKFNDEIDLFLPFIAVTLSSLGELEFTPSMLQKELEKLFGFKPPISAIKVFITRAKKRKLVVRENNAFIPNTIKINEWKNGYEDKKDEAITSLEIIRKDFADFALAKFNKNLSPNDCDTLIIDFIEKNISSVTESRVYEKNELNEDIKNTNHVTASFISHIYKNKNASLDHFARFVKGMLLANYLCFADKISTKKDYKSITVYIDTPIIIGLLGFNGKQEQQTQEEFISLLKTMSIDIRVFDKTINEIEGLLYAWHNNLKHNNYERFNTKTLETLRQMGCDAARLDTEIKLLSSTIKNLDFTIENGYKIIKQYQCDENALEEAISHNFKKGKNLKHDTVSISRIHNMRKGGLIKNLNQSFSLFVTSNTGLVSVANDFFTGEISKNCIPLVVSEQWMTTMFWLKKPDLFGDLPMEQIVSSAYGLLYKDDGFWTTFIKKLKDLEERGVITEDDLTQVRWDSDLLGMVHDISVDVGDNFSDENVFDIVQSIKNKHVAEKDKEIEEIKEVNYKEVAALKNESNSEISGLRETIRKQNERIEKVKLRDHKISKIISILSATLLALVFVVGVFWTAFVNFPPEIIPNKMAEMYKNYWLTGYAAGITILISF
ncbi:hypothetical protein [Psychrobacter immobilis]|uniref:hypothetical protein n=1 Tax=Psychrobacter immobilis TaxID=498 RepID=UPI001919158E|nr:hypothetical protein [Psychrobacter immobilis]